MSKYLDYNGLSYFWGKLKAHFQKKKIWYGTCPTSAGTSAKVVTTDSGDFTLTSGNIVYVKFTNGQSYNGTATLTVDGTTATNVNSVAGTTTSRYYWKSNEVVGFVYDGSAFVMMEKAPATTTYYGITKLSSSTTSTSEALSATPKAVKTAYDLADGKQDALVSGTNIKTINNESILGSGNITVSGGSSLQYTEDAPDSGSNTNNVVQNDVTGNIADGGYALAEGLTTIASGKASHSEGFYSMATGDYSHAEGGLDSYSYLAVTASGEASHAEGLGTEADGDYSHAQNLDTKAMSEAQTAIGKYNVADADDTYALIIGNGTAHNARSNALTVDWNGSIRTPDTYRYTTDWDTTTSPSSDIYKSMFETTDANDDNLAYIGCNYGSDGTIQSVLGLHRNVGGSDIYHTFGLRIDSAGNRYYDNNMSTSVNGSTGKLYFYRFGNVVYMSSNGAFRSKSTSIANGTTLTQTVPSGYRPVANAYVQASHQANNNWRLEFTSSGNISFLGNTAWNSDMWICGMWMTADPLP